MNNLTLENALNKLQFTLEKNVQLDFFRYNGEVLLQIFKGSDVKHWEIDLEILNDKCFVFQVLFHKNKTNNDLNYDRFISSNLNNEFEKIPFHGQLAFFSLVPFDLLNENQIQEKIVKLIIKLYNINTSEFYFTLNAY